MEVLKNTHCVAALVKYLTYPHGGSPLCVCQEELISMVSYVI